MYGVYRFASSHLLPDAGGLHDSHSPCPPPPSPSDSFSVSSSSSFALALHGAPHNIESPSDVGSTHHSLQGERPLQGKIGPHVGEAPPRNPEPEIKPYTLPPPGRVSLSDVTNQPVQPRPARCLIHALHEEEAPTRTPEPLGIQTVCTVTASTRN